MCSARLCFWSCFPSNVRTTCVIFGPSISPCPTDSTTRSIRSHRPRYCRFYCDSCACRVCFPQNKKRSSPMFNRQAPRSFRSRKSRTTFSSSSSSTSPTVFAQEVLVFRPGVSSSGSSLRSEVGGRVVCCTVFSQEVQCIAFGCPRFLSVSARPVKER